MRIQAAFQIILMSLLVFSFVPESGFAKEKVLPQISSFEKDLAQKLKKAESLADKVKLIDEASTSIERILEKEKLESRAQIEWAGLKETMAELAEGLKSQTACEQIESKLILQYGNREETKDKMPQFLISALNILKVACH